VTTSVEARSTTNAARRQARKDLARLEQQIARLDQRLTALHDEMAAAASNYERLTELQQEVNQLGTVKVELESAWLEAAELAG
jgi:ATP-binding cassette subfamily F protein uup